MSPTKTKTQRQPCEIVSRVTGYLRSVNQYNPGKESEYEDRKTFQADCE